MILGERSIVKLIDRMHFPFLLAGTLFLIVIFVILLFAVFGTSPDTLWMIGATELLIYLIINAICSLVVHTIGRFVKRTILAYLLHLSLLVLFIRLIAGGAFKGYDIVFPIYGALVFCFAASMGITLFIRQVLTVLKDS